MKITAKELIKIAEAEIGYKEKKSNSHLDSKTANAGDGNYTKYGRDLYAAGMFNGNKNGYEWCAQFVTWCALQLCGDKKLAEKLLCQAGTLGAGCKYAMDYYKSAGRFDGTPKVGDQIFFRYSGNSGADHTGIVVGVTDKQITTIEGNKNNQVQKCVYNRTYYAILGYGHPKYDEEETKKEEVKMIDIKAPQLESGSKGLAVKMLQYALVCKNKFYTTKLEKLTVDNIDGIFGKNTKHSVIMYQLSVGLEADGIVGVKTWAKLMEG